MLEASVCLGLWPGHSWHPYESLCLAVKLFVAFMMAVGTWVGARRSWRSGTQGWALKRDSPKFSGSKSNLKADNRTLEIHPITCSSGLWRQTALATSGTSCSTTWLPSSYLCRRWAGWLLGWGAGKVVSLAADIDPGVYGLLCHIWTLTFHQSLYHRHGIR